MIIAEIGSNPARYGWKLEPFIRAAKQAGADAVKIQLFRAESFPAEEQASKRVLEFPRDRVEEFVQLAHASGLQAGASVFDAEAVTLAQKHCDFIKLAAREEDNRELLINALTKRGDYKQVYRSVTNRASLNRNFDNRTIHFWVIPEYPTPLFDALLGVFYAARMFKKYHLKWGWSSHALSKWDCVLAAKKGASVIEKHLCVSRGDIEAGHSLLPGEFREMCKWIT